MDTTYKREFGRLVRELRKARNMSQMKLAELAELHLTYIAKIERQGTDVGLGTLLRLAKALKVAPAKLVEKLNL